MAVFARSAAGRRGAVLALVLALAGLALGRGAHAAAPPPAAAQPTLGKRETVLQVSGRVDVRLPHSSTFVRLVGARSLPDGAEVDAAHGHVRVTVATELGTATSSAEVYGSRFVIHQASGHPAITHFTLTTTLTCTITSQRKALLASAAAAPKAAKRPRPGPRAARLPTSRRLFASEKGGHFETDARYAAAIGIGTSWEVADTCFSSIVRVTAGIVQAKDLLTGAVFTLRAGDRHRVARPETTGFLPSPGVYYGVTGQPVTAFTAQVGRRQAVYGAFTHWGQNARRDVAQANGLHDRLLLHISTAAGYGKPEVITPGAIARGEGDAYLVALNGALGANRFVLNGASSSRPAYLALLPEMNQANNAYSAFNPDGSVRDADHSSAAYIQAWRRSFLIIRGGPVATINVQLATLKLPPVQANPVVPPPPRQRRPPRPRPYRLPRTRAAVSTTVLPSPNVAFLWAPQTAGSPDVASNRPAAYYPGDAYVDIVGTDFYSRFPNFSGLSRFYAEHPTKPFGFNEWGMWVDGSPSFPRQFFAFLRSHPRVKLVVYNQGGKPHGPFRLEHFPAATAAIRHELARSAAVDYTSDWAP